MKAFVFSELLITVAPTLKILPTITIEGMVGIFASCTPCPQPKQGV